MNGEADGSLFSKLEVKVKVKVNVSAVMMARGSQERFILFDLRSGRAVVVSLLLDESVGLSSRRVVGGLIERFRWIVVDGVVLSCRFGDGVETWPASGSVPLSSSVLGSPSTPTSSTTSLSLSLSLFLFPLPSSTPPFFPPTLSPPPPPFPPLPSLPSLPKTQAPLSNSTAPTPNLPLTPLTPSHKALYSPTPYAILLPHSPPQQTHQYNSSAKNGTRSGSYTASSRLAVAGPMPFSVERILRAGRYIEEGGEEEGREDE